MKDICKMILRMLSHGLKGGISISPVVFPNIDTCLSLFLPFSMVTLICHPNVDISLCSPPNADILLTFTHLMLRLGCHPPPTHTSCWHLWVTFTEPKWGHFVSVCVCVAFTPTSWWHSSVSFIPPHRRHLSVSVAFIPPPKSVGTYQSLLLPHLLLKSNSSIAFIPTTWYPPCLC